MDGTTDPSLDRQRELFLAALERSSPAERAAFLDGACGNDASLRARVESLLRHYSDDKFLEAPAADLKEISHSDSLVAESIGSVIGRYKLLQKIGEGGMGVVYMAEQEEPIRRKVALKLIKLGMDTKSVIARFEAERQALALMDHPNIARVLDGGVTDAGRPFFVMEFVQGIPITEFCDKNQLSAEARVKLFIPVCQAIQSAHQKGIIHRDLKPTNILVTLNAGIPHPMVIDFGVAKATNQKLTEKTVFTNYATMIGTPAYMSPEQAEMSRLDVDTRTDIYGLGVLLYELLTGTTPFPEKRLRSVAYNEMQRIIMEEEPERPSTRLRRKSIGASPSPLAGTRSSLATDLDWIVMKCLEKDRARRYETANGLATDLQRHLDSEPVIARPPSTAYRFQKAVRRNKLAFLAGAVVAMALVIGTVVSAWQAVVATQAKTRAVAAEKAAKLSQQAEASMRIEAEHELYAAKMNLAQQAWDQNNMARLRQLLDETQTYSDRGFEWYYWQREAHLALKTLRGERGAIFVAISRDGQRIITCSVDHVHSSRIATFGNGMDVWDMASGKILLTIHSELITSVAFSPDGRRIVSGSTDATAKVWDADTGRQLLKLIGHTNWLTSVAFSPDGQRIVTTSDDQTARIWDAATGKELWTLAERSGRINSAAFSPDGRRIVTGGQGGTAKVWDAASGSNLLTLSGRIWVYHVEFSPDGRKIITCGADQTAKVWEAATGKELLTLAGHKGQVYHACFSPDGQRIATSSEDQTVKVWDAATGQELCTLKGHTAAVGNLAFFPDSRKLITGSLDETTKIWDASGASELTEFNGHDDAIFSVGFSPDGKRLLTSSWDGTARVWEAATGRPLLTIRDTNREFAATVVYTPLRQSARVYFATYSSDGRRILTCDSGSAATIWDAANGKQLMTLHGHTDWVVSGSFSPDGQRVATASVDQTAKIWDAATGSNLLTLPGHPDDFNRAIFSPDGRRIATCGGDDDPTGRVWDVATGRQLLLLRGHSANIWCLAFSADGGRIATASDDQTAKVWDATTGKELLTLRGHRYFVNSVAFSPDGRRILTASEDRTAKVWDAASGRELLTLRPHDDGILAAAFSPDGQSIVTGSRDHTANESRAATPEQVAVWQEEERAEDRAVAVARAREEIDTQLKQASENFAQTAHWAEATNNLLRAIEHNPGDPDLWFNLVAVYVQTGPFDVYREHCRESLERFGQTTDPYTADRLAKECLILPNSGANLDTLAALADIALTNGSHLSDFPFFQFCKGLAEYRQGRFASAADWMRTVLTNSGPVLSRDMAAYMVLAMSQYQLRQIEQARASFAKGAEIERQSPTIESGDLGGSWRDWIFAHALKNEASLIIEPQPGASKQSLPAQGK